eukprot:7800185-Pyramimonas_sp.AAC.1
MFSRMASELASRAALPAPDLVTRGPSWLRVLPHSVTRLLRIRPQDLLPHGRVGWRAPSEGLPGL